MDFTRPCFHETDSTFGKPQSGATHRTDSKYSQISAALLYAQTERNTKTQTFE